MINRKRLFISGAILLVSSALIASYTIVPHVFAWSTSQSASTECNQSGFAEITVGFSNQESTKSIDVTAKDEQTGNSVNFGTVAAHENKDGIIVSGQSELQNGTVDVDVTWTDDKSQHEIRKVNYSGVTCHGPTPTAQQTQTPSLTPTEIPTTQPTATPTPTETPIPTATPTETPNPTPVIITVTNNNNPDQENHNDITINNNTQVLGASTATALPSTGPETPILLGLLSCIPTGFGLRKLSQNKK